jgi:hypothetical protein
LITEETLLAVNNGIFTDSQLDEALEHYSQLESLLLCHKVEKIYHLTWKEVYNTLYMLKQIKITRNENN